LRSRKKWKLADKKTGGLELSFVLWTSSRVLLVGRKNAIEEGGSLGGGPVPALGVRKENLALFQKLLALGSKKRARALNRQNNKGHPEAAEASLNFSEAKGFQKKGGPGKGMGRAAPASEGSGRQPSGWKKGGYKPDHGGRHPSRKRDDASRGPLKKPLRLQGLGKKPERGLCRSSSELSYTKSPVQGPRRTLASQQSLTPGRNTSSQSLMHHQTAPGKFAAERGGGGR